MTNKEKYRDFCKSNPNLPIFMTDWWMDAVCAGKQWDTLIVQDEQGEILAAMPYLLRKRLWTRYIVMPQMTQIGGPWLREDVLQDKEKRQEVCTLIADELKKLGVAYYYQHFSLNSPAALAFKDLKFKLKDRITYRIEDLTDLDSIIDSFSKNKKRQLQKALSLHTERGLNVEDFYRFHMDCLQEKGKQISYVREFLLVLERKTSRIKQSEIIAIRNADNVLLAAAFVVWDRNSMYYLIPCYSEKHKASGASALLVLECLKLAREKGVAFDFEGSQIKGIANHYKQFGSKATSYYGVEKYYKWWFWFANMINLLRERRMR